MKKRIGAAVLISLSLTCRSQTFFQKKYYLDDTLYYSTYQTIPAGNKQFLNMVTFVPNGSPDGEMHLLMIDSTGNVNWYRRWASSFQASYSDLDMVPGGQIAVVARYNNNDITQMIFDAAADMMSAKVFSFGTQSVATSIACTPDSHFVMSGILTSPARGMILETDYNGNLMYETEYRINNHDHGFRGVYLLSGNRRLFTGDPMVQPGAVPVNQMGLLVTDAFGNAVWGKQLGDTTKHLWIRKVLEMADGSIMVFGIVSTVGVFGTQSFAVRLSAAGDVLWAKKIFTPDYFELKDAVVIDQATVGFSGWYMPATGSETFVCSMDTSGNILTTASFKDLFFDVTNYDMINNHDGTFLFAGMVPVAGGYIARYITTTGSNFMATCNLGNPNVQTVALSLYDSSGFTQSSTACLTNAIPLTDFTDSYLTPIVIDVCAPDALSEPHHPFSELIARPDDGLLTMEFNSAHSSKAEIMITDISGRILLKSAMTVLEGMNARQFSISGLAKGIYFLSLNDSLGLRVTRFVSE